MSKARKKKHDATGRAKTSRFVALDFSLLKSDAYRSLPCGARALLVEFHLLFNGGNNGELFMSQRTAAERLGLKSHRTAANHLRELEDRGFIRTRVKGAFHNKTRHATTYVLTNQRLHDRPATRDFRDWRPAENRKARVQSLPITGAKKAPIVPSDWPDGCQIVTQPPDFSPADVGNNGSTYNIPRGEAGIPSKVQGLAA